MSQEFIQSPFNKIRKDKFIMVIPVPKGLKGIANTTDRANSLLNPESFSISVYGTIAPPINVPAIEARYSGQTVKATSYSRPPFPPLSVNFTIDNRFNNYWFIYKWLNILNDDKKSSYDTEDAIGVTNVDLHNKQPHAGTYSQQLQYYATDISIFALDEYEKRVIEFKYIGAFPTSLGEIKFSYRDPGEAETTAEFAYSQFTATLVENVESL